MQRLPKLVIVPGMDGTGELLDEFVAALGGRLEVCIISYPRGVPLDYVQLASRVIDELPRTGRYLLLGESFGGPLALMVADTRPRGLVGVVLCASFARFPVQALRLLAPFVSFAPVVPPPRWLMSWLLLGRWATASLLERLAKVIAEIPPAVWRVRARAALQVDVTDAMARLAVPLLCLRALEDRLITPTACLPGLGGGSVVDVQAPHFLLQSEPGRCAEFVIDFARRIESGGPSAPG